MTDITQEWKIGDCLDLMKDLPDNSVDLIIADPPYYKIKKDAWDNQWKTLSEYLDWLEVRAIEMKRVLKNNGSLYMFGDDERIAYVQVMMDKHFNFLNHLVWYKRNNMPIKGANNFRKFAPVSERILFYSSNEHDTTGLFTIEKEFVAPLNPFVKILKEARLLAGFSINQVAEYGHFYGNVNHGGAVTNWENGYSIPSLKQWKILCEYLQIIDSNYEDLRLEYEDLRRTFNYTTGMHEVFDIPIINTSENTDHPTTKPRELIKRLVESSSNAADVILDPFLGSGVTMNVCVNLNRNFIGFEISDEWEWNYHKILDKKKNMFKLSKMFGKELS